MNGVVQYPKGFLKEAFELVRERGGVCIADEVSGHGIGAIQCSRDRKSTRRNFFKPSSVVQAESNHSGDSKTWV